MADADAMKPGDIAFEVEARVHTILSLRRLVEHNAAYGGIATMTRKYTEKVETMSYPAAGYKKSNSQFSPAGKGSRQDRRGNQPSIWVDDISCQDNHIDYCGGIEKAIEKAYEYVQQVKPGWPSKWKPGRSMMFAGHVQTGKVNRIMLDNFQPATIRRHWPSSADVAYETEPAGH